MFDDDPKAGRRVVDFPTPPALALARLPLTAEEMRLHPVSRELRALMDRPTAILAEPEYPAKLTLLEATCRTAFRMAIGGNVKAITIVFDRLEGRVGIRSGETDPASDVAREGVQQAIEDIVTTFTEANLAQADDSTAHDSSGDSATSVVIDDESQRRFGDHGPEPRPATTN